MNLEWISDQQTQLGSPSSTALLLLVASASNVWRQVRREECVLLLVCLTEVILVLVGVEDGPEGHYPAPLKRTRSSKRPSSESWEDEICVSQGYHDHVLPKNIQCLLIGGVYTEYLQRDSTRLEQTLCNCIGVLNCLFNN